MSDAFKVAILLQGNEKVAALSVAMLNQTHSHIVEMLNIAHNTETPTGGEWGKILYNSTITLPIQLRYHLGDEN